MTIRTCNACGRPLRGRKRRWCNETCRNRGRRGRQAEPSETTDARPDRSGVLTANNPGRCREALDRWIAEEDAPLPAPLVAAALTLASEVDADPSSSPLWSRYLEAVGALLRAAEEENQRPPRDIMDEIREEART